jgi:hypothetical protein
MLTLYKVDEILSTPGAGTGIPGRSATVLKAGRFVAVLTALVFVGGKAGDYLQPLTVDWSIGDEPVVLHAEPWFAGAISSIKFRNVEYLNSDDHGRELQGAVQFRDAGECLNPTLAGAKDDPPHGTSSKIIHRYVTLRTYGSTTQMAFWNRPGSPCEDANGQKRETLNSKPLSLVAYSQKMTLGYRGLPNAVLDEISIKTQRPHESASVEALTGYMPEAFDTFWLYEKGKFRKQGAGEKVQEWNSPTVLATSNGASAMGVLSLQGEVDPKYAGARFPKVTKWSLVFHTSGPYASGFHRYTCVWIIGTLAEVERSMRTLVEKNGGRNGDVRSPV